MKYVPSVSEGQNFLYHVVCGATDFNVEEKGFGIAINL